METDSDEIKNNRRAEPSDHARNTFYYIKNYLDPHRKWNKAISGKQRIDLIKYSDVNWAVISGHIKGMNYRQFLTTPYWKAIAAHAKYKAGYRCHLCINSVGLAVHHRSYHIHGREHANMHELIVLCNRCHQKFHGDKVQAAQSPKIFYGSRETIAPPKSENSTNKVHVIFLFIGLLLACFRCLYIDGAELKDCTFKVLPQKKESRKSKRW